MGISASRWEGRGEIRDKKYSRAGKVSNVLK